MPADSPGTADPHLKVLCFAIATARSQLNVKHDSPQAGHIITPELGKLVAVA